jgi:hypothetical protein
MRLDTHRTSLYPTVYVSEPAEDHGLYTLLLRFDADRVSSGR